MQIKKTVKKFLTLALVLIFTFSLVPSVLAAETIIDSRSGITLTNILKTGVWQNEAGEDGGSLYIVEEGTILSSTTGLPSPVMAVSITIGSINDDGSIEFDYVGDYTAVTAWDGQPIRVELKANMRYDINAGALFIPIYVVDNITAAKFKGNTTLATKEPTTPTPTTPATTIPASSTGIHIGDKVKVLNNMQSNGQPFKTFYEMYDVLRVSGDNITIGIGNVATATVKAENLQIVIGKILNSDIMTYINGNAIPSWSVDNKTLVVAEDLAKYGFTVKWSETDRTLKVTRNADKAVTPIKTTKNTNPVGSVFCEYNAMSGIKTYIDGKEVKAYNINGYTLVNVEDLAKAYGSALWNDNTRELKVTMK